MVQNFFDIVNNKYKQVSKTQLAQTLFKNSVDIGTAIVNIVASTGIAGFKFQCPQREEIEMQSDVTTHYTDNNSPIQDHVALKPVVINLQGLQGDYFYSVNQIEDIIAQITPTLSLVKQFLPQLTAATQQIKKQSMSTLSALKQAKTLKDVKKAFTNPTNANDLNSVDLFQLFQNLYKLKSPQTRAFFFFEALWKSKALFTVETTWKTYNNMLIVNVKPIRDDNLDITDFRVTFQQMDFASTTVINLNNKAGRTRQQLAQTAKKGIDKGVEVKTI